MTNDISYRSSLRRAHALCISSVCVQRGPWKWFETSIEWFKYQQRLLTPKMFFTIVELYVYRFSKFMLISKISASESQSRCAGRLSRGTSGSAACRQPMCRGPNWHRHLRRQWCRTTDRIKMTATRVG